MELKQFYDEFEHNLKTFRPDKQRSLDYAFITFVNKHVKKGSFILDIGCGFGELIKVLGNNYKTYGIEISLWSAEGCRNNDTNIIIADASSPLPFRDNFFDCVLSIDSLEHLYNWQLCLDEIKRILKPDGKVVIFTPNREIWKTTDKYKDRIKLLGDTVIDPHIHEFTSQELCRELYLRDFKKTKLHIKSFYYRKYFLFGWLEKYISKNTQPEILVTAMKNNSF